MKKSFDSYNFSEAFEKHMKTISSIQTYRISLDLIIMKEIFSGWTQSEVYVKNNYSISSRNT